MVDNHVTGSVGDGPIVGARLRVRANNGAQLMETESSATADYEINIKTQGENYAITTHADRGIDLVTNAPPDFALLSAIVGPNTRTSAPPRKTASGSKADHPFAGMTYHIRCLKNHGQATRRRLEPMIDRSHGTAGFWTPKRAALALIGLGIAGLVLLEIAPRPSAKNHVTYTGYFSAGLTPEYVVWTFGGSTMQNSVQPLLLTKTPLSGPEQAAFESLEGVKYDS